MIAYGAARYALARGDKAEARELWPLIEWCLEYCNRKLTPAGVVASNSDELENRFRLVMQTSVPLTLYYDALRSAVMLGRELGVSAKQLNMYRNQANALEKAIEKHFGYEIEGFTVTAIMKVMISCVPGFVCLLLWVSTLAHKALSMLSFRLASGRTTDY